MKWSQYQFFIKHIELGIANGSTALNAVHELDAKRGLHTVPQLHRELQPKGRKKKVTATTADGAASTSPLSSHLSGDGVDVHN